MSQNDVVFLKLVSENMIQVVRISNQVISIGTLKNNIDNLKEISESELVNIHHKGLNGSYHAIFQEMPSPYPDISKNVEFFKKEGYRAGDESLYKKIEIIASKNL